MKHKIIGIGATIVALIMLGVAGLWYYVQTNAFMETAGREVAELSSTALGVQVDIGSIQVNGLYGIELNDIAIYDKQAECLAKAEKATVSYRLFSALLEPADAVKEVVLANVTATVEKRADGTWNFADLMSDSASGQEFHGKITVQNAAVTARFDGQEIALQQVNGSVDCDDFPLYKIDFTAENQGANLGVNGTVRTERQILNLTADNVDITKYLTLLPAGTLPDNLTINGGQLHNVKVNALRDGSKLSYSGEADFADGAVQIERTPVEAIDGHISFTDAEALVSVQAKAAEQLVKAHGKIRLNDGSPYLDMEASSDSFDPAKILDNIPYSGAASFTAQITGPMTTPQVTANVKVASGEAVGIAFADASADVRYQDDHIFAQNVTASTLGGKVTGELALATNDLTFTAHLKPTDIDLNQVSKVLPQLSDVSGQLSADLGLAGEGTDITKLKVYGSADLENGSYQTLPINSLTTSFYLADDDLTIDYASLNLPHQSSMGVEGSIKAVMTNPQLDVAFYGGHFDLALLKNLVAEADLTGWGDFKGTVQGPINNPQVDLKFSGLRGTLFKQPFDSLQIKASGSLDGVGIENFLMEKDGRETWRAAGSVGFSGARKVNLQLDTMGARMEDIAALIAPDQPITGNVDNIIKVTGTLDNPQAVGYIHFYRGSYYGVLLSGMDGDYFLENGLVRLQDFHAYSPMIDMVLNGTIDMSGNMNMEVAAKDIDLKRVEHKLPYEVSGHGSFNGQITGNINKPEFYGILDAASLVLNGQTITQLHGTVAYQNNKVTVERFGFMQNDGSYDFNLVWQTDTNALRGNVVVQRADINAIAAMLNQKNDILQGKINSGIEIGGTIDEPRANITGDMLDGTVAGYYVHEVELDLRFVNKILYINDLHGKQGQNGTFSASGLVPLEGPIEAKFVANDIEAGMFTKMAGLQAAVTGSADITASFGGYLNNPAAQVQITATNGGVQGSTFDKLIGNMELKNGLITIDKLQATKLVGTKNCAVNAAGIIPLQALTATDEADLNDYEQVQLSVALDQADLSLLPVISNHVDWAMGATEGNIKIHGSLAHPLVDGTIAVPSGAVKIKELEKPITDMQAKIDFSGTKVTVSKFVGKMGDGTYDLSGSLDFAGLKPNHYDFQFKSDGLDIQSNFFRGPLNATIHVFDTDFFGNHWPKIVGQVDIDNCLVSVPTIPDSDGELPEVVLDVNFNVGNKVHCYSPYLYDLYLTGQVHAGGITSHPNMSGSLQVKRGGTINYLKTVFKIREGVAYFNQIASFLPSIDFVADTKLTQAKVFLAAKGPLGNGMELKLSSSPEMSQTQIIQMLTLRNAYKNGQANLDAGDLLSVGLQMSFLSEVEDVMRNFLFLDQFTLSRGDGSAFDKHTAENDDNKYDFNVEMGKYISDKVMLKYTRGLSGDHVNRYGVQYDFNDKLGFTLEREGGEYIIGLEARTTF